MARQNGSANGHVVANGQAKMNEMLEKVNSEIEKQENIFLFIPNIIGAGNSPVSNLACPC